MSSQNLLLLRESLTESVKTARRQALKNLIVELVQILGEQNFQLDDLVQTLGEICQEKAYLNQVAGSLQQVARQISLVREELR